MKEYAVMPKEHYVALCDFIRERLGTEGLIRSGEVLANLQEVVSFTDDANATPEDMVKGSSAWVKGKKVEGNVEVLTGIGGSGEPGIFESTFGAKLIEISYNREKPVFLKEQAKISAYAPPASFGNAKKDDVPEGVTFTSVEGVAVEGTVKKLTGLSGVGSVSGECDSEGHITATFYNNEPAFLYPDVEVKVKMNPSDFGNAETDDVEKGKIFTSVAGIRKVGTGKGYDQGYSDGYKECENTAPRYLFGTQMLYVNGVSYSNSDSPISMSLEDCYAYFLTENGYVERSVSEIVIDDKITIYDKDKKYYTQSSADGWAPSIGGDFPDERYMIVRFAYPVEVSKEFYDIFAIRAVDNDEYAPYLVGYDQGVKSVDLEDEIAAQEELIEEIKTALQNKANGYNKGYDDGYDDASNTLWGALQFGGQRTNYYGAFRQWNNAVFHPVWGVKPTEDTGVQYMFFNSSALTKIEKNYIDLSGMPSTTSLTQMCGWCTALVTFEDVGLPAPASYNYAFNNCRKLQTIEKIRVTPSTSWGSAAFLNCYELINLIVEGTIGQGGLNLTQSTKLSKASITSIVNALSTTTSGLSITLSKTAVVTAFADDTTIDGTNSSLWKTMVANHSNWTINLV